MAKKVLSKTLYAYVRAENKTFAATHGRLKFGSVSMYVDSLITRDREEFARRQQRSESLPGQLSLQIGES